MREVTLWHSHRECIPRWWWGREPHNITDLSARFEHFDGVSPILNKAWYWEISLWFTVVSVLPHVLKNYEYKQQHTCILLPSFIIPMVIYYMHCSGTWIFPVNLKILKRQRGKKKKGQGLIYNTTKIFVCCVVFIFSALSKFWWKKWGKYKLGWGYVWKQVFSYIAHGSINSHNLCEGPLGPSCQSYKCVSPLS